MKTMPNETNKNSALALFSRGAAMLAEADTIQKAHDLKNLAITAAEWAKRKGMGEDAVRYARSYALEAERKLGDLLKASERAKGAPGPGRGKAGDKAGPAFTEAPTLAELGLTKKESSQAQLLADITREAFDEVKSGRKKIKEEKMKYQRPEMKPMAACARKDCAAGSHATCNCADGASPNYTCTTGSSPMTPGKCVMGVRAGDLCLVGCEPCLTKEG
jgi:hypothetical protein